MKAVIIGAISLSVLTAAAQNTVVIIPAFENRFGGPHDPVIVVNSRDSGRFSSGSIPSQRGSASGGVSTTGNRRVQVLDAATMNIPVFPGTTLDTRDATTVTVFPRGVGFAPMTNVFGQVIGGADASPSLPPRTTGTGPATNAVPAPAAPRPSNPDVTTDPFGQTPTPPPVVVPPSAAPQGTPVPRTPAGDPRNGAPISPEGRSGAAPTDATPAPAAPRPSTR